MAKREVDIKVRYIPDTSALKNIKEIRMPEIKVGGKDAGKGVFDSYNNAIRDLNRELSKGTDASAIIKAFKTVEEETTKVRSQINSMKEAINQSFQSPSNQSLIKDYQNLENQLKKLDAESQKRRKKSAELSSFKSQNNMSTPQARKEISKAEALVAMGEKLNEQDQERLEIAKQIVAKEEELIKLKTQEEIRNAQKEIKTKMASPEFESMMLSGKTNQQLNELSGAMSIVTTNANSSTTGLKRFKEAENELVKQTKEAKDQVVKFGDIISGTFLGTSLSNLFQTGLQRGIEFFKEYDETLTRTMMVTGMTREEVNSLTSSYNDLANQLSSTTKDVAAAQLVFYQQGLGTSEALAMTEASIAISKTGGIEAGEAANRLTAAIRGYQLAASDAMDIADKMSALDAAAASSVDELTIAMQKSASQARMAGLDLDYYMAYLSTMQEVTREAPENIGTAMKSITSRMQEITDIGKVEEDGTTFSKVAKALNSIGIAATDTSGQLRPLQEIMNELGPMWATLDRNHQAYIATVLAGNRQQSRFIALMDNYDRALELVNISQNANGETAKQLRAYNTGLEESFTKLNNAWQQLATRLVDSSVISNLVDVLSGFVETINKIPAPLTRLIVLLGTLSKGMQLVSRMKDIPVLKSITEFLFTTKNAKGESISIFKTIKEGLNELKNVAKEVRGTISKTFNSIDTNKISKSFKDAASEAEKLDSNLLETNKSANDFKNTSEGIAAAQAGSAGAIGLQAGATGKYAETAQDASKAVDGMTASINNAKTAMENDDIPMEKQIDDTVQLETAARQGQVRQSISQAQSVIAQEIQHQGDLQEQYNTEMEKAMLDYAKKDPKTFNKVMGSWKRMQTTALKKQESGQLSFDFGKQFSKENEYAYFGKKISELGETFNNVTEEFGRLMVDSQQIREVQEAYIKQEKVALKVLERRTASSRAAAEADLEEAAALGQGNGSVLRKDSTTGQIGQQSKLLTTLKGKLKQIGSAAFSSVMTGMMTSMIAQTVGLNDELSKGIGLTTGLTQAGYKLGGTWGAVGGIIIGLGLSFINNLYPSLETVQKKLEEIRTEQDKLDQEFTDIESNLKVYTELSKKLNKSDEETEELKNSTEALAKALPDAVTGYDNLGNAIINTASALETLNKIQRQQSTLAAKSIEQYSDMQKAEASNQKKGGLGAIIIGSLMVASGLLLTPFTGGASNIATTAGLTLLGGGTVVAGKGIWDVATAKDQAEENARILEENYAEIYADMQSFIATTIAQGNPEYEELRQQFASQINTVLLNGEIKNEGDALNILDNLETFYGDLGTTGLDSIAKIVKDMQSSTKDLNLSYSELKSRLEKQLKSTFGHKTFSEEEWDVLLSGTLRLIWTGDIDVESVQEQIRASIEKQTDYGSMSKEEYKKAAETFINDIADMDPAIQSALNSAGLLNAEFVEMYTNTIGGLEDLTDMFTDSTGAINTQIGAVNMLNEAYEARAKTQDDLVAAEEKKAELEKKIADMEKNNPEVVYRSSANSYFKQQNPYLDKTLPNGESAYDYFEIKEPGDNTETGKLEKEYEEAKKQLKEVEAEIENIGEGTNYWIQRVSQLTSMLDGYQVPTFQEIADEVEEAVTQITDLDEIVRSLNETGGRISLDQFVTLFSMLDDLEEAMYTDQTSMEAYGAAFETLADSMSYVNGEMLIQAEGVKAIANIKAVAFQASMKQQAAEIQGEINKVEMQREMIRAQIQALQAGIEAAENGGDAEKAIEESLNNSLEAIFNGRLDMESQYAAASLAISNELLVKTADVYSRLQKAMAGESVDTTALNMDFTKEITNNTKKLAQLTEDGGFDIEAAKNSIAQLEQRYENLGETISVLESKKKVVSALSEMSPEGLAAFGNKEAQDNADEYIGKLKITFSLLQQIERLQHKISINERRQSLYRDVDGEKYADSLINELSLMEQQYEVRKQLFQMQQDELGKQRGKIEDSPYAQLFSFASDGLIQLDWDAYWAMPGEMQEEVDTLVEEYERLQDEVEDTEEVMYDYADAIKDTWLEVEDLIIEAENTIVDALKNREKILHDARVKALDDEINMIEKAVEARKKARENENDNKELYEAQEALRRATLDSSGKNNASLLQLQQDLEDKQLEISEKRFEQDMEDRKNWLQDTKDAETETYEYRLETMTWYWEEVQVIMESGTENIMTFLMQWDEQYRISSETQQQQILRGWTTMYEEIQRLYDKGFDLTTFHNQMQSVVADLEKQKINIQAIETAWKAATAAASTYSGVKNVANYGSNFNSKTNKKEEEQKEEEQKEEIKSNKAPSPAGIPKEPGNLTVYELKNGKLTSMNISAMPTGYDEGAVPFSVGATLTDKDGKTYYEGANGQLYSTKDFKKVYAQGGYVDYTGPAWVDGTKSHPEAFLSAYQTKQIGALAGALDSNTVNNVSGDSNISFGSISFNVASMSSAADGKKALDIFVQGANELMAKKGIGTKLNLNIK